MVHSSCLFCAWRVYLCYMPFKIHAPYTPAGDQPSAIAALTEGVLEGEKHQTLLGVTGSGKTFTMTGTLESPGIMVLILQDLFKAIQERRSDKEFSIKMSYVEIYNEVIFDLLIPNGQD